MFSFFVREPLRALCIGKYTKGSSIAEGPRDARVSWNLVNCCTTVREIKLENQSVKPRLHDTTGCQTGCTTRFHNRLNEQPLLSRNTWPRLMNI